MIDRARWRKLEEAALEVLTGAPGLWWTPLDLRSDAIQLVAYDGEHIGHIRREALTDLGETWVAMRRSDGRSAGQYGNARDAAEGLARSCGINLPG